MSRVGLPKLGLYAVLSFLSAAACWAQDDAIDRAMSALQRGDLASAEQILNSRLKAQPKDEEALSVLGVVLDQEKKYTEAEAVYQRALANSPPEPALLNNFGNHLLAVGKAAEARATFLRVIGMDAQNVNALVQLAQIALRKKAVSEAKIYVDRLSNGPALKSSQDVALGVALESAAQHGQAESFFAKAAEAEPSDFEALYDLGLAASHAGHNERARGVLQQAVAREPENVDALYDLAAVTVALDDKEEALRLLAKAYQLAPHRTDVLQLEARTSAALGYFGDAARVWQAYLEIAPNDEVARRERAFAETATGENTVEGLAELKTFAQKHPNEAVGHYELGIAETPQLPELAVKELDRALALKPELTAGHGARGLLLYRQGKTAAALADFEFVAKKDPRNGSALDHLGETYLALDRASEALPTLRKAAELLPNDSTVLLHLGRALSKTNHREEASTVFARCHELGPNRSTSPHPAGLLEFLGLPADEQRARYRAGVEHTLQANPENAEAQVRYLAIVLEEGKLTEASTTVQTLTTAKLSAPLLVEAARTLVAAEQYGLVKRLLDQAPTTPELALDAALAEYHVSGARSGLGILDKMPETQRNGDYDLARAQMLAALDRRPEAEQSLQHAIHGEASRPELYRDSALMLIKDHNYLAATRLLAQASTKLPNDPDLMLLRALTLELAGAPAKADVEFRTIESRWADWPKLWLAESLVFEARQQPKRAQTTRQAAIDLGASEDLAKLGRQSGLTANDLSGTLVALFP